MIAVGEDLLQALPLAAACALLGLNRGSYYRVPEGVADEPTSGGQRAVEEAKLREALEGDPAGIPRIGLFPRDAVAPVARVRG